MISARYVMRLGASKGMLGGASCLGRARCVASLQKQLSDQVLASNTVVYTWGNGTYGQLGHANFESQETLMGAKEYIQTSPRRVLKSKNILSLSMSESATFAITKQGQVLACGATSFADKTPPSNEFHPFFTDKKIVFFSAAKQHAAMVDSDGQVYTWGDNGGWFSGGGRLGHGDKKAVSSPKLVDFFKEYGAKVVQVGCGEKHTVFLTDDGEVLSCGVGEYGRLGTGDTSDALLPTSVEALEAEDIVQIAAGNDHTLALTKSGVLYGWGRNQQGQLGQADSYMDIYSMEDFPRVIEVFRDKNDDNDANFNIDSATSKRPTADATPVKFKYVAAGQSRSAAISEDGEVYVWGARLSHKPKLVPVQYLNKERVCKVVVVGDSSHSAILCLTEQNKLYSLGDASSKCLGRDVSGKDVIPKLVRVHDEHTRVLDVFGGFGCHAAAIVKAPDA